MMTPVAELFTVIELPAPPMTAASITSENSPWVTMTPLLLTITVATALLEPEAKASAATAGESKPKVSTKPALITWVVANADVAEDASNAGVRYSASRPARYSTFSGLVKPAATEIAT